MRFQWIKGFSTSLRSVSIPFKRESGSQVQSNRQNVRANGNVSIPFKRESGSQVLPRRFTARNRTRFQFPSNGKVDLKFSYVGHPQAYVKLFQFPSNGKVDLKFLSIRLWMTASCFNSLQTGKWISREKDNTYVWNTEVSIPFKRESGSQASRDIWMACATYSFNSLQTGKWISSSQQGITHTLVYAGVSIPFKRESGSQVWISVVAVRTMYFVSIPFKRESGSQAFMSNRYTMPWWVSIPFKRESGSQVRDFRVFLPPFLHVSIPFKRESGSQEKMRLTDAREIILFQFPSNGKVDLKDDSRIAWRLQKTMFQFPSNGKVDLKPGRAIMPSGSCGRFNSLQTGKWISSKW